MNAPLLAGMFWAWTAVQVAMGIFFSLAYVARRRDAEYLLFGLLCFALATTDAGLAMAYGATRIESWPAAATVANSGGILAAALNAHFVLVYVARRPRWQLVVLLYAAAAFFVAVNLFGDWFVPGSARIISSTRVGIALEHVVATPTAAAITAYGLIAVEHLLLGAWLARAYRAGMREALSTLITFVVAVVLVVNDVLVASGLSPLIYLTPYGFLVYGFGVANTLLVRYRRAAERLEATANELRETTDELRTSYVELQSVQDELFKRKQLASVGELAASIAHEVRNPLAIIVNAASSLRRPKLSDEDRKTLFEIIEEETSRLNDLVAELLRYARPVNPRRSDVSVKETVKGLGTSLEDRYELIAEVNEEAATVWADPTLLRLAIDSLLDNACQAMPNGGRIRLVVSPAQTELGPCTSIVVADEGCGMDESVLERAADPFFTTQPRGTGLGLPIVERIIRAHDGRLKIDSDPGKGTTVTLLIPRRPESLSRERGSEPAELAEAGEPQRWS